jgi:hypothetical protein
LGHCSGHSTHFRPSYLNEEPVTYIQEDWIMRQVERIVAVLLRLLGLKQRGDFDLALEQLQEAYGQLFQPFGNLIHALEPASIADLVHDPGRLAALAQLMALEAELLRVTGDSRADACADRARAIAAEAVVRDPDGVTNAATVLRDIEAGGNT